MKILVTGGAGYIGSHTLVELINAGYEPIVVDNYSNSFPESISRVERIVGKKVKTYEADIRDGKTLSEIFDAEGNIEWVIHFAGLKAVGESCVMPIEYYDNNLVGTLVLLEVMKEHNCKKIIFSSSATVYGDPEYLPYDEKHPTGKTTNPYGTSKYFQERILMDLCNADKDFTAVILRYFNPVGAHESGLIGEDPQGIPNNLTPFIGRVLTGRLKELSVFGNDYDTPDGTCIRDYIHVVDLAKGHVAAIKGVKNTGVSIYNLGTGKGSSVLDVVYAFEKASGKEVKRKIAPRREGDLAVMYADVSKAERELGWKAEYDLEQTCRSAYAFNEKNPNGYSH